MKAKIFFFPHLPLPSYRLKSVSNFRNLSHYDVPVQHESDIHNIHNEQEVKEQLWESLKFLCAYLDLFMVYLCDGFD